MAMDWPVFAEAVESRPPLLEDLLATAVETEGAADAEADDLPARLRSAPADEREGMLVAFLQHEVEAVLRLASPPAPAVGFFELGMDSLMAVELRNRLNRAFAETYTAPNTLVFDYPDIATLARHLAGELGGGEPGAAGGEAPVAAPEPARGGAPGGRAGTDEGIAIVGMACRFPGAADIAAFARQLEAGRDAHDGARRGSARVGGGSSSARAVRGGGFVTEIEPVRRALLRDPADRARADDPRQRICWRRAARWRTPASIRKGCAAAAPASTSASPPASTAT